MTLLDDIAKLPPRPDSKDFFYPGRRAYTAPNATFHYARAESALARLALAAKLAKEGDIRLAHHSRYCACVLFTKPCDCGRDALLAALKEQGDE